MRKPIQDIIEIIHAQSVVPLLGFCMGTDVIQMNVQILNAIFPGLTFARIYKVIINGQHYLYCRRNLVREGKRIL